MSYGNAVRVPQPEQDPAKVFRAGLQLLHADNVRDALIAFENAHYLDPEEPIYMSYLGLARVLLRKDVKQAVKLCEKAAKNNLYHPEIYHNLGRVYVMRNERKKALEALQHGLKIDPENEAILSELRRMGTRKDPPIPILHRNHFLNHYLGKVLALIGAR